MMTLVAGKWKASFDMIDGTGKITTLSRELIATDYTEAAAAAAAHLVKLLTVTDTKCVAYRVGQDYEENSLGSLPLVTVLNSVQAVVSASILDQPNKFASIAIPGPKITVFTADTGRGANIVDASSSGLMWAYLQDFTEGGHCYISDHEHLDPVLNLSGQRETKYRKLGK